MRKEGESYDQGDDEVDDDNNYYDDDRMPKPKVPRLLNSIAMP